MITEAQKQLLKATCKEVSTRRYMPKEFTYNGKTIWPYGYLNDNIMADMDDLVQDQSYTWEELYNIVITWENIFYVQPGLTDETS